VLSEQVMSCFACCPADGDTSATEHHCRANKCKKQVYIHMCILKMHAGRHTILVMPA